MCDTCSPNWEPPAPGEGETFDPIADEQDAKRHARDKVIWDGTGEPAVKYAGALCVVCFDGEAVDGGRCVRCVAVVERGREWWAA